MDTKKMTIAMITIIVGVLLVSGIVVPVIADNTKPSTIEERVDNPATAQGYPLAKGDSFTTITIQNTKVGDRYKLFDYDVFVDDQKTYSIHFPNEYDGEDYSLDTNIAMFVYADQNVTLAMRPYDGLIWLDSNVWNRFHTLNPYDYSGSTSEPQLVFKVTISDDSVEYVLDRPVDNVHDPISFSDKPTYVYYPSTQGQYNTYYESELDERFTKEVTFEGMAIAPQYISETTEEPLPPALVILQIVPLLIVVGILIGAIAMFVRRQ